MSAPTVTARQTGRVACTNCASVWPADTERCPRCNARLSSRPPHGLGPVWAWLTAGVLFYIPANIWPMLITRTFGREQDSTILGGVIDLAFHGSYGVAGIVFLASIVIPIAKFAAIALLASAVHFGPPMGNHALMLLYGVVEFIGRWSMIDIFVVAILSALVQLGLVASLSPGPAAACFALSVAFTMLAARAFDSRLLWDRIGEQA
ncbi:paraquat-inducible protein A [Rhodobacteraceae bacterium NNCM2]|nr:paraquat-inducible protein A [Coraliihabitans acroporae]